MIFADTRSSYQIILMKILQIHDHCSASRSAPLTLFCFCHCCFCLVGQYHHCSHHNHPNIMLTSMETQLFLLCGFLMLMVEMMPILIKTIRCLPLFCVTVILIIMTTIGECLIGSALSSIQHNDRPTGGRHSNI